MKKQMEEIDAIVANPDAPTFENTILALEQSGEIFGNAHTTFANLSYSDSNDEIMALEDELSPILSNHSDDIHLNPTLFNRIKTVYDQYKADPAAFAQKYDAEDIRLLTTTYDDFCLAGANLSDEDKAVLREYNVKIGALENKFSQHLLKTEEVEYLVINDVAELEGLSAEEIATAKNLAQERGIETEEGKEAYVLNLVNTTRNPALCSLKNRAVREKLFNLSINRASNGQYSNVEIVYELLTLRAKLAKLLGFESYAAYKLTKQMAKNPENALKLLTSMLPGTILGVQKEKEMLLEEMKKDGINDELKAYDWEYYAEKVRESKFNVDPAMLKDYLPFDAVFQGAMIQTFNDLYGINLVPIDIPVYHKDVKAYEIKDENGNGMGIFYGDYFKRQGKAGGAWMTDYKSPYSYPIKQNSVVCNVMNIPPSLDENKPTFCPTISDASTVLHEYGHASHSYFSYNLKYSSLSSTNTSTDFVECPSTFHEDFVLMPHILERYAKHYLTNEPIDKTQLKRVIKASKFNVAYETFEYLTAALIDLKLHSLTENELEIIFTKYPTKADAIREYEIEILKSAGAYLDFIPPRYKTNYFNHSMTGYSSSYYAYIWSEIYAADAYRYINIESKNGQDKAKLRELGLKWRDEVLSRGNSRDVEESYQKFRGGPATTDALLMRRGLLPDPLDDDEEEQKQ
eukprot:UN04501